MEESWQRIAKGGKGLAPGAGLKPRPQRAGRNADDFVWGLNLLGALLVLTLIGAVAWYFNCPATRARAVYQSGVQRLAGGDVSGAQADLETALRIDPALAEAALCLGFVRLGIREDGLDPEALEELFRHARWGRTEQLQAADEAFNQCLRAGARRPLDAPVGGLAITNREMLALAWSGTAATALTRAAAAVDTNHTEDARAWARVALSALDKADMLSPRHGARFLRPAAEAMLR
ncbi:hypothetical protein LLH03_09375 [bacterium]|nr:hypothetical protein [bacterium]